MRRSTIEKACAKRGRPPPPKDLKPFQDGRGLEDTIFETDHPEHPVRWRFGCNGQLKAFVVYTKATDGPFPWHPLTGAEKEAVVSSLFSQQGA